MSRRDVLKEYNQKKIIETAKRLFLEKGIDGTTVDEIAKAAECSKTTLYAYFSSKDEIYAHMVLENILLLKESIANAIEENDTLEGAYAAICTAHVDFQENHPLYFETMIGAITENEDKTDVNKAIEDVGDEINQIIVSFLEHWIEKGRVRAGIDTLQTAFALWAGICGLITMAHNKAAYIKCMNVTKQEFLEYGFRTFLNSILVERDG